MSTNAAARDLTVGRRREIAVALEALTRAGNGDGSIVVVRGPAGIGKSCFLNAVRSAARARGAKTAMASNYAAARAPFGPFADIVNELRASGEEIAPPHAAERALFERCFGIGTMVDDATPDRRRLFVVLANALVRAAARTPLFLAIDDVQWADPESIEFLQYWATHAGRSRVATFIAARDRGDDDALDVTSALARFERVTTIDLQPLDERAARELIAFRAPGHQPFTGRTVDEICRLAEGNPLFLEELLQAMLASDGQPRLPRSIEQTARRRLRALDATHVPTIEVAAALGRTFSLNDLACIAQIEPAAALPALREARDAGLLDEVPGAAGRFTFHHELVRLAIYETMFSAERALVHRRIAELLEAQGAANEILADHWRRAGDDAAALLYAERAGDAARALGAYGSARNRYLDVIDGTAGADRARLCDKLAGVLDALGDAVNARRYLAEAIDFARAAGDGAKVAELECRHADVAYRCGDVEAAIAGAERVLDSPAAAAEQLFTARVSLATYYAFRLDMARTHEQIALADALHEGRTPVQEVCLEWVRATIAMETSPSDAWRESAEKCLAIAAETRPVIQTLTAINVAAMARECGRGDLARSALNRAITLADENGLALAAAYARSEAIEDLHALGRLDDAHALIRTTVALQVDAPVARMMLAGCSLPALIDLGISDQFPMIADRTLLDAAFDMGEATRFVPLAAAFATIDAAEGRTDDARALIERALRGVTSVHYISPALLALARLGDREQIECIHALFGAAIDRRGNRTCRLLVAALSAKANGDAEGARDALARASSAAADEGRRLLHAFALESAGKRDEALKLYEACGAAAQVARLAPRRGELTKRETEIAWLLREGLSNRAIADRLVLSQRTVENHIAGIFAKTGVRTRAEFTARANAGRAP